MEKWQAVLENRTGNHLMPFLWYAGESPETVCRTFEAIRASGIRGVTLENRGGNWFNSAGLTGSEYRSGAAPDNRGELSGFRLALDLAE